MNSLVSIKDLSQHTVSWLLQKAQDYLDCGDASPGRGTVVNLFFEPSTRTHLSFQMASQHLGLRILDFSVESSSVKKGESLLDTLETLDVLGVDVAIVRHGGDWVGELQDRKFRMSLVNAGSGIFEHPTQALLDALTIKQHYNGFKDLTVTIVGDVQHSRVARSNVELLSKMGARVQFAGPDVFRAADLAHIPFVDIDQAVQETDVLMLLRVQSERHEVSHNYRDGYHERFGLSVDRLKMLRQNAIILHPGPVNRGVEICDQALEDPRCKVLQQVRNGVAVRVAVLDWCLQGDRHGALVSVASA